MHDPLCIPDAMIDVRVHLPAGAQKDDGLGAGVAMVRRPLFLTRLGVKMMVVHLAQVCVIVSLLTGMYVSPMTCYDRRGVHKIATFLYSRSDTNVALLQVTLRGQVSPVGEIKEKRCWTHAVLAPTG